MEQIKLRLVVKLTVSQANRLPNKNNFFKILGIKYPLLKIDGRNSSSVVKIKVKLNEIREEI